jgi:bis(5'-nucleosyl)-tetraphosphatase (symmetrical)
MTRRIFVGDVQGCREELERLLEAVRYDPVGDVLHPVGDLVNRGPDSLGALRLVKRLGAEAVLGNHDLHLLHSAAGSRPLGPRDTLADVLAAPDREELLDWLAALPFVRVFDDLYLVHAGLHPSWIDPAAELAGADPLRPSSAALFAARVRACDAAGNLPERDEFPPRPPFRPWHAFYRPEQHGGRTVVFGHWSVQGLVVRPHLRGLDTGCVWGRELCAWIAEEDRVVSVPAARAYAPLGD